MSYLPSTKSLQCFIAVANQGGIRPAGNELSITQSAVSHQINQLEELLGAKLFQKQGRNIVLTGTGRDYLKHVEQVLNQLEKATDQACRFRENTPLTVSAPPTFIANWLLPNLGEFENEYDEMSTRIIQSLTLDRADSSVDISIEYRFRPNPAFESIPIMEDSLSILASPKYVARHGINSIEDLRNARLIETEQRLSSWVDVLWDQHWIKSHPFLLVPYSFQAFEAAALGYGVVIGNTVNARRMLAAGALISPFELPPERWPEVPRYYLTIPKSKQASERVQKFKHWLLSSIC